MEPEIVDAQIREYLEQSGLLTVGEDTCWKIQSSKLSGRGVIATRNIECDELVYADKALVDGPRCLSKNLPMCVRCYKTNCVLFPCDHGCGLPVCSDACQDDPRHREAECSYLNALQPTCSSSWSAQLLQAVVPIRTLFLPKERSRIFYCLQSHQAPRHGLEVDLLKKHVKGTIKKEDEEFMRLVCRALDTNSFETVAVWGDATTSLRALFPLGALTNHLCIPNTRHIINDEGDLVVYAATFIAKGEEITMSYTDILWDTMMRRQFLLATKHFSCVCSRCCDATEHGSLLSALCCANEKCLGILLPNTPLSFNSSWTCSNCKLTIKSKQISAIRAGIVAATEEVLYDKSSKILRFIKRELSILVPNTNYIMMDMIFKIVSILGRTDGCTWSDLTDEELIIKIQYCKKLLKCINKLNCGNCTKKGLILYELFCTNAEVLKRISKIDNTCCDLLKMEVDPSLNEQILQDAINILKNDNVVPRDYRQRYKANSIFCHDNNS